MASVLARSEEIPHQIGPYLLDSCLEEGGSSFVYLGHEQETKQPLAVKILKHELWRDAHAREAFLEEARMIETLNHPNIIKVIGYGEWEQGVYLAMEFVQGIRLRECILQQAMSLQRALEVGLQIAHAITHLHGQGIVHRDLKPENVMMTAQGGVKLIDFGLAKFSNRSTIQDHLFGTPSYMSPEQRKDPNHASFPADIFSFGVILYELILGRLCYGNIQISLIPRGLQPILAQMLQPRVQDRYEDIVDVVTALTHYLRSDALVKDKRGSDYINDLNDELKKRQALLLPQVLPQWPWVNLAMASNCNLAISSVYYDFFRNESGHYHIVMAESLLTGVGGLLEIATIRGIVRSLVKTHEDPEQWICILNNLLIELDEEQAISFGILTLKPKTQQYRFISCGYHALWQVGSGNEAPRRISSNNPALGIQPDISIMAVDAFWPPQDRLCFHTFQAGSAKSIEDIEEDEKKFLTSLEKNRRLPLQKQVDAMFRETTSQQSDQLFQKLVTLVAIQQQDLQS